MRRILVTGANKGIGLATVRAILEQHEDTEVLLGSRNADRGRAALETLTNDNPQWASRLHLVTLDVADDTSVTEARAQIERGGHTPLYGIVNNAGIGLGSSELRTIVNVNTLGVVRVCEAFMPLIADGGRVVNVASASGPNFVATCSASRQAFFTDAGVGWPAVESVIDEAIAASERGEDIGNAYGFSKACVSLYTMILAREHPRLLINACTPGYIETDLTRPSAQRQGVAPAELGMKPPREGTRAILHLLFGQPHGTGHYYGSDAKRSPLDRYRAPGSPEFKG